jgi:hypothetical protein
MIVRIISVFLLFTILPFSMQSEALKRDRYRCFTKELFKKLQGSWVVETFLYWGNDDSDVSEKNVRQGIPKKWKGKKLEINEEEIKWLEPMLDAKTQEVITHSCKMSNMHLSLQKLFVNCEECKEEYYKYLGSSPYDWYIHANIPITFPSNNEYMCNGYYDSPSQLTKLSLKDFDYNINKERISIHDFLNEGYIILKKETPMDKIDFNTLENCEDVFEKCEDCDGLVLEDKSVLKDIEGEWKIFKTKTRGWKFPSIMDKDISELIGKKISVTKDGFRFLTKNDTYSRYFHEYYCPNKRASIVKNTYSKVLKFGIANQFDYFKTGGLLSDNSLLPVYIKNKKGIMEIYPKLEATVLAIDNACQLTIFDFILVFYNKTMVLQMGGEFLYLKRVKK